MTLREQIQLYRDEEEHLKEHLVTSGGQEENWVNLVSPQYVQRRLVLETLEKLDNKMEGLAAKLDRIIDKINKLPQE